MRRLGHLALEEKATNVAGIWSEMDDTVNMGDCVYTTWALEEIILDRCCSVSF